MLPQLISHNDDLKRLFDDGYELSIVGGQLVVSNVPYVAADRTVKRGALVSELCLNADKTQPPNTHVIKFTGDHPCDKEGKELAYMVHSTNREAIGDRIEVTRSFSCKPTTGVYANYYDKVTTYASMISVHAQQIEPDATARTHAVTQIDEPDSPFRYLDNASGLAGISEIAQRVAGQKVGIIGLGGSGSYVLDLLAKCWIAEIHLFDGDDLIQHNAFRCPGAVPAETLLSRPMKADHYAKMYDSFRKGVISHPYFLNDTNVAELDALDFIFICIDKGSVKKIIVEHLEALGKSFIDVGMGIEIVDGKLLGVVRTNTSTPKNRETFQKYVRFGDGDPDAAYTKNVQIVELNALNACLAVIKWKKLNGIYLDLEGEMNSNYTVDGNHMSNE